MRRRLLLLAPLAACATPRINAPAPHGPIRLAICKHGFHTEIGIPTSAITGPIAALPTVRLETGGYVLIGFGAKVYFAAANPNDGQAAEALLPGPSAIDLAAFGTLTATPDRQIIWLNVDQATINRLLAFTWAAMPRAPGASTPTPIASYYNQASVFYAATPGYSGFYNCNNWAADALRAAGLPFTSQGVMWAADVQAQARAAAQGD